MKNRMREMREGLRISMKEASNRLGIPYTTYVNYEKGLREPHSEMLIRIADFYKVTVDYLICKTDSSVIEKDGRFDIRISTDSEDSEGIRKGLEAMPLYEIDDFIERATEEDLKIALFGGDEEVTDEMWQEAKFAAQQIKERYKRYGGQNKE